MIVLDTTVLVYAVGSEHEYREPCRSLVEGIANGRVTATTTVEVIQEFAHVRARRRGRADAPGLSRAYVDLLAPLLVPSEADLRDGLDVWSRTDTIGAFDAVLVQAARSAGATALVSADSALARASGVPHLLPSRGNVERLLE